MLVVVGSPAARLVGVGVRAAGLASEVARAAAAAGGSVQIVGRLGDDPTGDAVLVDLAAAGVGHVAVLRSGGETTPLMVQPPGGVDHTADEAPAAEATTEDEHADGESNGSVASGLPLDAADLELALRYLPDYRVIVAAPGLDAAALATVVEAAGWSGARLVALVDGRATSGDLPPDATLLEAPPAADSTFAALVARYAVELDRGREPGDAFAAASAGAGWRSVEG